MKKRIMILGAGVYQVPLINTTREMGFEAVVVSTKGNYPGISLADIFLEIDTTDTDSIVQIAREYGVAGIVTTGTDVCLPAIGAVVDALGLKGPSKRIADIASSKTAFRLFLSESDLNSPDFARCECAQDVWDFYQKINDSMVVKPDDSSGSRGVTVLDSGQTKESIMVAYRNAVMFSRNGRVCAESFVEGIEAGGEAFFLNGNLQFFTTTFKHMDGVLVQGHSVPSGLSESELLIVKNEVCCAASNLGYENGPMNFDVIIHDKRAIIIELGLRNGGNGIFDLIYHSEGINLAEWLLAYTLGGSASEQRCLEAKEVSSYVFGSERAGTLISVSSLQELTAAVPEVFDMVLAQKPGDHVGPFVHNANQIGYVLINCGLAGYKRVTTQIRNVLRIEVQ